MFPKWTFEINDTIVTVMANTFIMANQIAIASWRHDRGIRMIGYGNKEFVQPSGEQITKLALLYTV